MRHGDGRSHEAEATTVAAVRAVVEGDAVLLLRACGAMLGDGELAAVRAAVPVEIRHSDGYLFQHLVTGPRTVTTLAALLGVTQQAASKQVADLERRGLVERRPDPADGRSRPVALTPTGRAAVEAGREARTRLNQELVEILGPGGAAALRAALLRISDHTGAALAMAGRRLRPEHLR